MPLFLVVSNWTQSRKLGFSSLFFFSSGVFFLLLGCYLTTRSIPGQDKSHFGHVYDEGHLISVLILKKISETTGRQRFYGEVLSVSGIRCDGKIFLSIESDNNGRNVFFGDTLWTSNRLRRIGEPLNPGAFDFQSYAAKKNIFHQLYLRDGEYILKEGKRKGLIARSVLINKRLQNLLSKEITSQESSAISKALLLGQRDEISPELAEHFKNAGAMHILAISGLHVGIVLLILMFLTRPLIYFRKGRFFRILVLLFGLWGYAVLTGLSVSTVRAVNMFTLLTIGSLFNRKIDLLSNLVNSAFIMLLLDPLFLFDVGFQMSYSALAGIGVGDILGRRVANFEKWNSRGGNYFRGLVHVSCSAQLGVLPLSLFYFNQFSGAFLLSSIFLLPLLGATLIFGYSVLFISAFTELPRLLATAFQFWMNSLNQGVKWLGGIDWLVFKEIYFPVSYLILLYLGLGLLAFGLIRRKSLYVRVFLILLIGMQLIWIQKRWKALREERIVVFHHWKESLVFKRDGFLVELMNNGELSKNGTKSLREYSRHFPGDFTIRQDRSDNLAPIHLFFVGESLVGIIDKDLDAHTLKYLGSMARFPRVLIFSNSPRFNLDRLLAKMHPEIIVVDGSNHRGFVKRCMSTCESLGIEFYATYETGAFYYPR